MIFKRFFMVALALAPVYLIGCGASGGGGPGDYNSRPAVPEPEYFGTPTPRDPANSVRVTLPAKFLYRQTDFHPALSSNGLGAVVSINDAGPIPFAEFHVYDSSGNRVQQGETTTNGVADFLIPKTTGIYTVKVFSRANNNYLKVSVLNDIYANEPYFISQPVEVTPGDVLSGTKSMMPFYAHANENISPGIEGGAFNIYFNALLANEYIRRNIEKNGDTPGVPSTDREKWWVADKVSIFWKAGFNPNTYLNGTAPLSFYASGQRKLFILGGINGNVSKSDTDHFDDSVILHEYAHFLEDVYGNSQSPGGSHNGNFVIDPRLSWSEGWATYFSGAVLTGTDAYVTAAPENRLPINKRLQYYVDTFGYKGSGTWGLSAAVNLAAEGDSGAEPDNVAGDLAGTGIFRELSVARTLFKSTRSSSDTYAGSKKGAGISFKNIWKTFSGEEKNVSSHANPAPYSLSNRLNYPLPNMGLFNWLLSKNGVTGNSEWDAILTEEKQRKTTQDYAYLLADGTGCTYTFTTSTQELFMGPGDPVKRSHPQVNNDFYLYYHSGGPTTLGINYTTAGQAVLDLDLILYTVPNYVYFEDTYWMAGRSSSSIARQSRSPATTSESVSLDGLSPGYYLLNVKVNVYNKTNTNQLSGSANYTITKNGVQQCGTERP